MALPRKKVPTGSSSSMYILILYTLLHLSLRSSDAFLMPTTTTQSRGNHYYRNRQSSNVPGETQQRLLNFGVQRAPNSNYMNGNDNDSDEDPPKSDEAMERDHVISNDNSIQAAKRRDGSGLGGYDAGESLRQEEKLNVGDPQLKVKEKERSVTSILKELAAIQQQGPQKYCILGTRHCSYLHQQIIELL